MRGQASGVGNQGGGALATPPLPRRGRAAAVALLAVSWSLIPVSSSAQTARLALPDSVSAGQPFEAVVVVERPAGAQATFPAVPVGETLRLGDAEVIAIERRPPAVRGALRVDSAVVRARVFAADSARVGPVAVRITSPTDTTVVEAGAAVVPVRTVLAGEAPPYEPAPVGPPEPFPSATPLWVALGAAGLLLLGGAGWGIARSLRRPEAAATGPLPYPAALDRLAALDAEAPGPDAPPEAIEAHVVAVRGVLRGYLADRLAVPAREATTAELGALLGADARVPDQAAAAVRRALMPTDLVAFARARPAPHAVARLRAAARAAVDAVEAGVRERTSATADAPDS